MKKSAVLIFALCLAAASKSSSASEESYYNYLRGLVAERAGNGAKALEAYEQVVQEDPQALQVFRDLAELHLRMGQPDAALRAAERVKDLAPADPESFLFLGNVLVAQGDLAKAAEAYEKALKLDPQNLRALENLGNYYAIVDPEKALAFYQRYIDIDPQDADIYFQMALVYQKRGNAAKALPFYKKSLELDPQQLASHLALAELYDDEKSTAAATEEYEGAAQMQPTNAMIWMRLGNLYYRDQKWDEALKAFQAAQTLSPQEPTVYYWLARIAEEKKMWKDAAANAEKAYTLSQDSQFLPLAAYYLTLDRQLEKAITYLEKARTSDPGNANVLLFLGMDYLDLDKPAKALEPLLKGVTLYPKDSQMRFQLAMVQDRLGHFDEAVRDFQDLLTIDPQNAAAMNYLGYSWADRGIRLEESEKLLRQAVAIEPDSGAYLDSLGWVRLKRGDPQEARHYLEMAAMHTPDPLIFDHLGDACVADKHTAPALQAWSKAITMDPKNEAIRKKLLAAAAPFFASPDGKIYLKYLEGNFKQANTLQGRLEFEGRYRKQVLRAEGQLVYQQPDHVRLVIPSSSKSGKIELLLDGDNEKVKSGPVAPMLHQMAFGGMSSLAQLLSGRAADSLEAVVDPDVGVETRFSRPNPSGGQDDITIAAYDFIDGLWLPSEIRIQNVTTGWKGHVALSDWVINESTQTRAAP